MNKMYQYLSGYRLPTEYPFKEAARLYWRRIIVICIAVAIAMAGATLVVLAIVAFREGYGFIVIGMVVLFIISKLGGGGSSGGGTSSGGQMPPSAGDTKREGQPEQRQFTRSDAEKVLVPAARPKARKLRAFAIDPKTGERKVIDVDADKKDKNN